jgi:tartrate dehydratase beta subunit/fumarate hydratase class I family protein
MIKLSFPFTEEKIRALKVGDEVLISGIGFTRREHDVVGQSAAAA